MDNITLNYYALCVSILCNCLPEVAFEKLQSNRPSKVKSSFKVLSDTDVDDMVKMHQEGLTYKQIGEIYGIDHTYVRKRIRKRMQVAS